VEAGGVLGTKMTEHEYEVALADSFVRQVRHAAVLLHPQPQSARLESHALSCAPLRVSTTGS
jgi:hypothetical protein